MPAQDDSAEQVVRLAAKGIDVVADPARQFEADRRGEIALRLLRFGIAGVDVGLRFEHLGVPRAGDADGLTEAAGPFFGPDRKCVGSGTSVSVRVYICGRRSLDKTKNN